jgi:(E)-4-hydroxy-3-methyl-but-2-enyl pyrophosphate reductase
VKRAINLALEASESNKPIFTTGPLIHNPQMVQELQEHGVQSAENAALLQDCDVIIRSHGIPVEERQALIAQGNRLIDATCPYVSKAQEHVHLLCEAGYPIVILGDADHPEVIAMRSYCHGETWIVADKNELPDKKWLKLGVISQTTKCMAKLVDLMQALVPRAKELRLYNTICTATSLRQDASLQLAKKSDLMIVIGGKNSSNTRMLASLCAGLTTTIHVETADEISLEALSGKELIGLTAGASTPDKLIVQVFNKINEITGDRTTVKSVEDIPVNKEESC